MERLEIRVTKEQKVWLGKQASKAKCSIAEYVRAIIEGVK